MRLTHSGAKINVELQACEYKDSDVVKGRNSGIECFPSHIHDYWEGGGGGGEGRGEGKGYMYHLQ